MAVADAPLLMGGNEDADETALRHLEKISEALNKKSSGPPPWLLPLVLWLIGQLVLSVWWAATMQSRLTFLEQRAGEQWQLIETQRLRVDKVDRELDERIRGKVRETMDDFGYLRVRPTKGD